MNAATDSTIKLGAPIRRRIARARRALLATEFGRRLAVTLALAIALFASLLVADAAFELPLEARKAGLWITGAAAAIAALWTLAVFFTGRRNSEEIALMVERQNPELDSRLIGAVQFANGHATVPEGAPTKMAQAMVGEAEASAKHTNFLDIVDPRQAARALLAFVAVLLLAAGWAFAKRDVLPALIARALGDDTPLPRDTAIADASGDALVGIGDRVDLGFTATGVLPPQGELSIRYESGRRESAPLLQDENQPGLYIASIDEVPESFTFSAEINDASTKRATVTAIERPAVESITARQSYPAFTGLEPTQHGPGDFALLAGSDLAITLVANKPVVSARLRFVGNNQTLDLAVDPDARQRTSANLTVPSEALGGFTVSLIDEVGLESKDDTVYRVTLLADRPPEVRITFPRRAEELVTRRARVLVRYETTDRFGIASLALRYQREAESEPGTLPVAFEGDAPKSLKGELEWDLAAVTPVISEGETIEYWLEATDQNTSGERVGRSERLRIKVVTPEEKRADLLGRASDTLGGISETTDDQQRLNEALKKLIEDSVAD